MFKFDQLFYSENKRTLCRLEKLIPVIMIQYLHFIIVSSLLSAIYIILFYVIYNSYSLYVYMW